MCLIEIISFEKMAQKFPIRIISVQSFCPLVTLTYGGFLLKGEKLDYKSVAKEI